MLMILYKNTVHGFFLMLNPTRFRERFKILNFTLFLIKQSEPECILPATVEGCEQLELIALFLQYLV